MGNAILSCCDFPDPFCAQVGSSNLKTQPGRAQGESDSPGGLQPGQLSGQPAPGQGSQHCAALWNRYSGQEALPHTEKKSPSGNFSLGPGSGYPSDKPSIVFP